jgi:hypothetical protein
MTASLDPKVRKKVLRLTPAAATISSTLVAS